MQQQASNYTVATAVTFQCTTEIEMAEIVQNFLQAILNTPGVLNVTLIDPEDISYGKSQAEKEGQKGDA